MGICLCNRKDSTVPHSDLFVPQINDVPVTSQKKRILKLKTTKNIPVEKSVNFMKSKKYFTTEKIISTKTFLKSNSEILRKTNNLLLLFSIKDIERKYSFDEYKSENNSNELIQDSTDLNHGMNGMQKFKTSVNKPEKKEEEKIIEENIKKDINYEVSEKILSSTEELIIANIFLHHYLFHICNSKMLSYLFNEIKEFQIDNGTSIFYEGDEGSCIFIIKSGKVELKSKNCKKKLIISDGAIFGELACVKENALRMYDANTLTNLSFYTIDELSFSSISDQIIKKHPIQFEIFNYLDSQTKDNLELLTIVLEFKKGHIITDLNGFFEIINGNLDLCTTDNNVIDSFSDGEFLGEKEYFGNDLNDKEIVYKIGEFDKNLKIIVKEDSKINLISSSAILEVFGLDYKKKIFHNFIRGTLNKNKYFSKFITKEHINNILDLFTINKYKKDNILIKDNIINKIQIIISGQIKKDNEIILKSGDILGEELLTDEYVGNAVVISNHLITIECEWDKFIEKIKIINKNLRVWIEKLRTLYLFQKLNIIQLIQIVKMLKKEFYNKGDKIIKVGDINEKVFFIRFGAVKHKFNNKTIREYHKGSSFGEIFLLNEKEAKSEIICSQNNTKLYTISKQNFFEIMGNNDLNELIKEKLCKEDIELFPGNLYYLSSISRSDKSNIYLVHNKIYLYSIKAIYIGNYNKNKPIGKFIPYVINEKKASKRLDNPFLIKYIKTLKNSSWCFFIQEYINGITMGEYIEMCKPFHNLEIIKFYSACLFFSLNVLNSYGIVHRDIKPENIYIDYMGYTKLIDFSSSKRIKKNLTKTIIGTPMFIAPEILNGKGYSYSCDYWSVGILLYYLYYGEYPFGLNAKKPDNVYKEILNKKIEIVPSKEDDGKFTDLLAKLLTRNEKERLINFKEIIKQPFYNNFNFDKLKIKNIKAPYIPKLVKANIDKMLNNLSSPFLIFIQKDLFDNNKGYTIEDQENNIRLDKDVVRTINGEESSYLKSIKNWFEDF